MRNGIYAFHCDWNGTKLTTKNGSRFFDFAVRIRIGLVGNDQQLDRFVSQLVNLETMNGLRAMLKGHRQSDPVAASSLRVDVVGEPSPDGIHEREWKTTGAHSLQRTAPIPQAIAHKGEDMIGKIRPHMHLIDNAKAVMEGLGITPIDSPIRGGTDGAALSYKGLPCPNLCTGGYNYHGKYEYASIQEMRKVVEILLGIVDKYGKDYQG